MNFCSVRVLCARVKRTCLCVSVCCAGADASAAECCISLHSHPFETIHINTCRYTQNVRLADPVYSGFSASG